MKKCLETIGTIQVISVYKSGIQTAFPFVFYDIGSDETALNSENKSLQERKTYFTLYCEFKATNMDTNLSGDLTDKCDTIIDSIEKALMNSWDTWTFVNSDYKIIIDSIDIESNEPVIDEAEAIGKLLIFGTINYTQTWL